MKPWYFPTSTRYAPFFEYKSHAFEHKNMNLFQILRSHFNKRRIILHPNMVSHAIAFIRAMKKHQLYSGVGNYDGNWKNSVEIMKNNYECNVQRNSPNVNQNHHQHRPMHTKFKSHGYNGYGFYAWSFLHIHQKSDSDKIQIFVAVPVTMGLWGSKSIRNFTSIIVLLRLKKKLSGGQFIVSTALFAFSVSFCCVFALMYKKEDKLKSYWFFF